MTWAETRSLEQCIRLISASVLNAPRTFSVHSAIRCLSMLGKSTSAVIPLQDSLRPKSLYQITWTLVACRAFGRLSQQFEMSLYCWIMPWTSTPAIDSRADNEPLPMGTPGGHPRCE